MNLPSNYNDVQPHTGEYKTLPLGGHILNIIGAKVENRKGVDYLVLAFDISENGEWVGFYKKNFEEKKAKNADAKWGCTMWLSLAEDRAKYLKGAITAIEESNSGFKATDDEKLLIGKKVGGVFGREQFRGSKGNLLWSVKLRWLRSVSAIQAGVEIPPDKLLKEDIGGIPGFSPVTGADDILPF